MARPLQLPERALVVQEPWASYLVDGTKDWELRGSACHIRGRIGIAVAGLIIGEVVVLESMQVAERDAGGTLVAVEGNEANFPPLPRNFDRHRVDNFEAFRWKRWHALVVSSPVRYDKPVPYQRKTGQVNWIKLDDAALRPLKRPGAASQPTSTEKKTKRTRRHDAMP